MKIVSVVGARPNFMKISPFVAELEKHGHRFSHVLVHTGQHYDLNMSQLFFEQLGLKQPDINLEVGPGSHARQTARVMERFEAVCLEEHPDWLVVVGDVNSTLACTLVASKLGIPVAHIEAGLRSFDRSMPEEINRVVTDALADLLLTPSLDGNDNLLREGVPPDKIHFVGNIMIDTLVKHLPRALEQRTFEQYGFDESAYIYVTLHRPSNVDQKEALDKILQTLQDFSREIGVIFPVHPRTRKTMQDFGWADLLDHPPPGLKFIDPVSYFDSICLTANSRLVVTDSGGLQEESTYLKIPCLTLRPNTERPVTLTEGSNTLTKMETLKDDLVEALQKNAGQSSTPDRWDGQTAGRIVDIFLELDS